MVDVKERLERGNVEQFSGPRMCVRAGSAAGFVGEGRKIGLDDGDGSCMVFFVSCLVVDQRTVIFECRNKTQWW